MNRILVLSLVFVTFAAAACDGNPVSGPTPVATSGQTSAAAHPTDDPGPTAPTPTPTPEPTPAAPTTVAVHVKITQQNGTPVQSAEITLDGHYLGMTNTAGQLELGTLTIGQAYHLDIYQGEYAPLHVTHTAAAGQAEWSYSLASLR